MKTESASSLHSQRKISDFCDIRVAPLVSRRTLENIKPYLSSLILYRKHPPTRMGRIDWRSVSDACGLENETTPALKKSLQSGLEAIIRWIDQERPVEHDRPTPTPPIESPRSATREPDVKASKSPSTPRPTPSTQPRAKPGIPPRAIEEHPAPLFDWTENPSDFREALNYHMRRHGDTYWHLHRAVAGDHETFDNKTLLSWTNGTRVPRSTDSFEVLALIERRYWLPVGYFKERLPHQSRSASGHKFESDVSSAERRRLAWHLPDDFNSLPFSKREEIIDRVPSLWNTTSPITP